MSGKEAKQPSSWSLMEDENIENVERIKLTPEAQRELGCAIGEFVFLEYPWAYVPRDSVTKLAGITGSDLEVHRVRIQAYQAEKFLVGYAANELVSTCFVICLTESARDQIQTRNRIITKRILKKVKNMMKKNSGTWSALKSDVELDQSFVKITRPFFEVELSMPVCQLGQNRELSDPGSDKVRDGYIEILPGRRRYKNVPMKMISRWAQTNLEGREMSSQSYFGYPQNKWTQYDKLVFVDPDKVEETDEIQGESVHESENAKEDAEEIEKIDKVVEATVAEIPEGPTSLQTFLESHCEEMINFAKYNSVINMHSDDIDNLAKRCVADSKSEVSIGYEELGCFIFLEITKKKKISDVSWHPSRPGYFAVCYVYMPCCDWVQQSAESETPHEDPTVDINSGVLLWSFCGSLRPKLILQDIQEMHSISFCPFRQDIVVGGSANGQIVIWDIQNCFEQDPSQHRIGSEIDDTFFKYEKFKDTSEVPIVSAIAFSNRDNSHILPIRAIRWLPSDCRIEPGGTFSKLPDNTSVQFMTASEDGSIAIWDLLWQPNLMSTSKSLKNIVAATMAMGFSENLKRLDGIFEPHFRLMIKSPKDSINLTILDLCLPPSSVYEASKIQQITSDEDPMKQLWLGLAQGQLILSTWRGKEFGSEATSSEICEILDESSIHEGPVIQISRCPQIEEVLLTIGGHAFAIWQDNYLNSPLLWQQRIVNRYTACCWSNEIPGVFLLGRNDGDLETWDIRRKTKEPVLVQTISGNSITGLYTSHGSLNDASFKVIGICDYNGAFHVYRETVKSFSDNWERLEWFRNFVTREVKRKREFHDWQDEYLKNNEKALERRAGRVTEEAKRRHAEARRKFIAEQEELARLKAERKSRNIPKSKDFLRKAKNLEIAKTVLLEKKGFSPKELENARLPLLRQQDEKKSRFVKAQNEIFNRDTYFSDALSFEFPENLSKTEVEDSESQELLEKSSSEIPNEDFQKYCTIRDEARKMLLDNPSVPKFNWNDAMREGRRRQKTVVNKCVNDDVRIK